MRFSDGMATRAAIIVAVVAAVGCQQLAGRSDNRKGTAAFREMRFVAAVAHFQRAIQTVDDPIIHYNLALAYSKVFKQGGEGSVVIDRMASDSGACQIVPGAAPVSKRVCVKQGETPLIECDDAHPCGANIRCEVTALCAVDNKRLADLATEHFALWLQAHPTDAETRALMTQVWIDSAQYPKAIDYWQQQHRARPNDTAIMGNLAGINLKANEWRKSIEWYLQVADHSSEPSAKVAAYQFIGNVAWSKLNGKTLPREQAAELADRGIGALQKAAGLQPENPKLLALMGSIYGLRALQHGASWAAGIDRAAALELQQATRVLSDRAKSAAAGSGTTPPSATRKAD